MRDAPHPPPHPPEPPVTSESSISPANTRGESSRFGLEILGFFRSSNSPWQICIDNALKQYVTAQRR